MDDRRRFSAAPVNFDRFVSLNRSHSRSLSPDNELHQMLRPYYQSRPASSSSSTGGGGVRRSVTTPVGDTTAPHRINGKLGDASVSKPQRRSADLIGVPGTGTTTAPTMVVEVPLTQAATPPSRDTSGSGEAATASTGTSSEVEMLRDGVPSPPPPAPAPRSYVVLDDTPELDRSQAHVEEVDLLLRAVQQLGCPLYNPVTQQFLCWGLHALERRSRASYGDIEGVSCDFCGDTDWLDTLADKESSGHRQSKKKGSVNTLLKLEDDDKGDLAKGNSDSDAHHRYLYHCPTCGVDICRACVAEVRANARFHVPCMQCRRCGGYEARHNAPLHQCHKAPVKDAIKTEQKDEAWVLPALLLQAEAEELETVPLDVVAPRVAVEEPTTKKLGGVALRGHVRLGLSRTRGTAVAAAAAAVRTRQPVRETAKVLIEESASLSTAEHDEVVSRFSAGTSPDAIASFSSSSSVTAMPARKRAATRRNASPAGATKEKKLHATADEVMEFNDEENDDLPAEVTPKRPRKQPHHPPQQQRSPFSLKDRSAVTPVKTSGLTMDAQQAALEASVLSAARYEVHLSVRTGEEAEEVRRMVGEQQLLCLPAPSAGLVSVAYFPTRLAAEACVERAAAGAVEAILKRHIQDDQ